MENLDGIFQKIESVDYKHREGGRYAYVQLMAYIRDLRNFLLEKQVALTEVPVLQRAESLLNEMVHLRFELVHQIVFEDKIRELSALKLRLCLYAEEQSGLSLGKVA